jgi:hypothetical protein
MSHTRVSLAFLFFLITFADGKRFNRDICYKKVASLLNQSLIVANDTIFHRDDEGTIFSTVDRPILTLDGCYEMCGTDFGWYGDIGPRLSTWLIPVFLLLSNMEVSPLDKRRYLMILHLLGDPIDSLWSLLMKLEAWSRCHYLAIKLCSSNNRIRVRNIATVLGGFEDFVGFEEDPAHVFSQIKSISQLTENEFDDLVAQTAQHLADSRTDERLRTVLATVLYIYQLVSAFVALVGGGSTSPPGGRIGLTMFMTWIVPSILLSNAIGGFTSRRTCYSFLEVFVKEATGTEDVWRVMQLIAPSLVKHRTVHDYMGALAWSGSVYTYRPRKRLGFSAGEHDRNHCIIFFLAAAPFVTSSIIGSVILWNTPPIGINCRNILIFAITGLVFCSTFFTHLTSLVFRESRHWYVMLAKDTLIAVPSTILIFLACVGRFNSCWCWSAVYSLGPKARVVLNAAPDFARYNATTYPILVAVCLALQCLSFVAMIWVGWRGWNVMRWSEEEKITGWRACRRSYQREGPSLSQRSKSCVRVQVEDVPLLEIFTGVQRTRTV